MGCSQGFDISNKSEPINGQPNSQIIEEKNRKEIILNATNKQLSNIKQILIKILFIFLTKIVLLIKILNIII